MKIFGLKRYFSTADNNIQSIKILMRQTFSVITRGNLIYVYFYEKEFK